MRQEIEAHFFAVVRRRANGLHTPHYPVPLLRIDDMHKLSADGVAVGFFQRGVYFAQRRIRFTDVQATGLKHRLEISRR